MPRIPLLSKGYKGRSPDVSAQRRVNLYPEFASDAKDEIVLVGTPGKALFADLGAQPCRGLYRTSLVNKIWSIHANKFYELLTNGTYVEKGTLNTYSGTVYFADNGTHILMVDGTATGYIYTIASGAFSTVADVDFVGGVTVQFIDGHFFVNDPNTGKVRSCTAPYGTAPITWNALDVSTVEGDPDNLVALAKLGQQIWCLGDF